MARNVLNLAMAVCILVAMDYHFTTNVIHEISGILVVLFFILHNILNRHWYTSIGKGKAFLLRRLRIVIDLLLAIMMLLATVTGLFISKTLFPAISVSGHLWVHELHTLSSYSGFILCGIHLGLHWSTLCERLCRWLEIGRTNLSYRLLSRTASVLIVGYGVYASFRRRIGSKLLLEQTYTSWGAKPLLIDFLLDHLTIMGCYAVVTYFLIRMVLNRIARDAEYAHGKKG